MHNDIEMLTSAIEDINALILQGVMNWKRAASAISKVAAVAEGLKKERERKEAAYQASIADAKQQREKLKAEAAEHGEEILGGETIHIDCTTGEQRTVIE